MSSRTHKNENMIRNGEKVFILFNNERRGEVQDYHSKPEAMAINECGVIDARSVPKSVTTIGWNDVTRSKFTIGFEIEKNSLHRDAVHEHELFCGFERDGSCGFEAVTHILPLLPSSSWRNKVFDMFYKSRYIIEDEFSPSNHTCGGHITVAVKGMSGDDLRDSMRKNCGILYALFRNRLKNIYCGVNLRMRDDGSYEETHVNLWHKEIVENNGRHSKYQLALVKDGCLEFRLPSRVSSVKQLMRRYELMYELVNFSVNNPNGTHKTLLSKIRPIILSMYDGDEAKTSQMIELAEQMRTYIVDGDIVGDVGDYIEEMELWMDSYYDNDNDEDRCSECDRYNHDCGCGNDEDNDEDNDEEDERSETSDNTETINLPY